MKYLIALVFLLPNIASALTITTADGGKTLNVTGTSGGLYDVSLNSGSSYLTGFNSGDDFCVRSSTCSGSPPYDLSGSVTSGSGKIIVATPTGTRGTDKCELDVTGTDASTYITDPGTTLLGSCTYVGWSAPPSIPTTSEEYLQECYDTNGTSTCSLMQIGGNITLILLIALTICFYLIIEHIYYRLFPSKMRIYLPR